MVGNNCDRYEDEEVEEIEAKVLAKEIGAIFETVSPKYNIRIDDLFDKIGKKFIHPNSTINIFKKEQIKLKEYEIKMRKSYNPKNKKLLKLQNY